MEHVPGGEEDGLVVQPDWQGTDHVGGVAERLWDCVGHVLENAQALAGLQTAARIR
jgi:hypothetical protein